MWSHKISQEEYMIKAVWYLKKALFVMSFVLIITSCSTTTSITSSEKPIVAITNAVYGPEHPYLPPIKGMFHGISVDGFSGTYSVYIPANFEPCGGCVMLLTPNHTSAQEFLESSAGQQWQSLAGDRMIALVVVEPDAGQWNLADTQGKRNDEAYLKKSLIPPEVNRKI
jgi:hypothetical protein